MESLTVQISHIIQIKTYKGGVNRVIGLHSGQGKTWIGFRTGRGNEDRQEEDR